MVYSCLFKEHLPRGPQIAEKGRQIAATLGKAEFTGSNGWLEKWKSRYNIKQFVISGESGDVRRWGNHRFLERKATRTVARIQERGYYESG